MGDYLRRERITADQANSFATQGDWPLGTAGVAQALMWLAADLIDARAETERLRVAILDIDAHASPCGSDEDGFVSGGYIISVGSLHRALGVVGHSAKKVEHAVWLEMAHPDCEACTKFKDIAMTALRRPSDTDAKAAHIGTSGGSDG